MFYLILKTEALPAMANSYSYPGSWFAHVPPSPGTALVFKQLRIFVDEGPVNEIARLCYFMI